MSSTRHTIVKRPLITEKTMALATRGWFSFEVDMDADKAEIAAEVNRIYNVKTISVRTIHVKGKTRHVGRKMREVKKSDWKKALVRLPEGQRIPVFEVTSETPQK